MWKEHCNTPSTTPIDCLGFSCLATICSSNTHIHSPFCRFFFFYLVAKPPSCLASILTPHSFAVSTRFRITYALSSFTLSSTILGVLLLLVRTHVVVVLMSCVPLDDASLRYPAYIHLSSQQVPRYSNRMDCQHTHVI